MFVMSCNRATRKWRPVLSIRCSMSLERVTSKASSFPILSDAEPTVIRSAARTRSQLLPRMDSFDGSGLGLARTSSIKFWASVAVLTASAAYLVPMLQ